MNDSERGLVFNIQGYSIHDGPGIRTTVFLKGCPLRCFWCQNPESHSCFPELSFDSEKCSGCGRCVTVCPEQAVRIDGCISVTNRVVCKGSGACVDVCPNQARAVIGEWMTADQVFREVAADSIFYRQSGGGVTLSGGEPLAQAEFSMSVLKRCREAGFHTALDTCGQAPWPTLKRVLNYVDFVLFDLKQMDAAEHRRGAGVSNDVILENAKRVHRETSVHMLARVTLVPGFNNSLENLERTARFIADELSKDVPVHLLPYHRLGHAKWARLQREHETTAMEAVGEPCLAECKALFESFGLTTIVGG